MMNKTATLAQLLDDLSNGISDDPAMFECRRADEAMKLAAKLLSAQSEINAAPQVTPGRSPAVGVDARGTAVAAPVAPSAVVQTFTLTDGERQTIKNLIALAEAVERAAEDGAEELSSGEMLIDEAHSNLMCLGLAVLDDLPDDKPDVTLCGPGKAAWALRRLLDEASVASSAREPDVPCRRCDSTGRINLQWTVCPDCDEARARRERGDG